MATKIKDQATAEQAARRLNEGVEQPAKPGEPKTSADKTTSERLFPEFTTEDGGIVNRPIRDTSQPLPVSATPAPEVQGQTQPTAIPTVPTYLSEKETAGKMVKTKVDGVESDVPFEQMVKSYQLERHWTAKLQNLAEERSAFERERQQILSRQMTPPSLEPPLQPKPAETKPTGKKTPEIEALEALIAAQNARFEQLQASLQPQIQDAGLKRVDQRVREALGETDFMEYAPKIKEWALSEAMKYPNDPNARGYFDSADTWYGKYQEMKLRDLKAKFTAPAPPVNPTQPVLAPINSVPMALTNSGRVVSMPSIEPSGGVPSNVSPQAGWRERAQQAFDQARRTGSMEDWKSYYSIKSEAQ